MRSRKASFTCPDRSRAVMSLSCGRKGGGRGGEGRGRGWHLQFPHILNAYLGYNFSDFLVAMETTESGSLALGQVKCAEGRTLSQRAQVQRVAAVGHTNTHHLHTGRVWLLASEEHFLLSW